MEDEDTKPDALTPGQVVAQVRGSVGFITLERTNKRNAMNRSMWDAIPAALDMLLRNSRVSCVVLTGSNGHFSSGADLQDVVDEGVDIDRARQFCGAIGRAIIAVATCKLPTLAALSGSVVGAAAGLAVAADFRIADVSTRVRFPFARLGIVPDSLTQRRLATLVGPSASRRMLFGAEPLTAEQCLALRLVDRVVESDALHDAVAEAAAPFEGASRHVIARMKRVLCEDLTAEDAPRIMEDMAQSLIRDEVRDNARRFVGAAPSDDRSTGG